MIEEIRIKNFAVIEDAVLHPEPGFNVITGETGAGKSVLLEALAFLFTEISGGREMLRAGAERLEVHARISLERTGARLKPMLESLDLDAQELLLRRVYEAGSGKTRAYINDIPVAAATLKALAKEILSLHTQGKTAELFTEGFAVSFLDRWAGHEKMLEALGSAWRGLAQARQEWREHLEKVEALRSKIDFLTFQNEELSAPELSETVLKKVQEELPLWMAKESMAQMLGELRGLLSDGESSASIQLSRAASLAAKGSQKLKNAELDRMEGDLRQASEAVESAASRLERLESLLEFDPDGLEQLLSAKAKLEKLAAKYKTGSPEGLFEIRDRIQAELSALENSEIENQAIQKRLTGLEKEFLSHAAKLSQSRRKAAERLGREMSRELPEVGLPKAAFEVRLKQVEPGERGAESAEFFLAPNPGEGFKPLRLIASSGEASRLMLALLFLQAEGGASLGGTLVFDEIEQGLSAQMTAAVGKKLAALSSSSQIFAITHSPILAAFASTHFYVNKRTSAGRTSSAVRVLGSMEERREEALRLLGAVDIQEKKILTPYIESLFAKRKVKA